MEQSQSVQHHLSQEVIRVLEASPIPSALNDDQQRIVYLNPAFTEAFGYEITDIPTLNDWWPKAYPDVKYRQWVVNTWAQNMEEARRENSDSKPLELDIRCKDSSNKTAAVYAASLKGSYKGIYLVILHDITESIRYTNEINQSKMLLENVINSTPDLIYVKNKDLETVLCNRAYEDFMGDCDTELQFDIAKESSGQEDISALSGRTVHITNQKSSKNDSTRFFDTLKLPIRDTSNSIIGILGICRDITENQLIEKNLKEAEQRLRLATEVAEIGIWEWHIKSDIVYWNANMFRLYGMEPREDGIVNYADWAHCVFPEELAQQEEVLQRTIIERGKGEREFHINRQNDGQIRIIQATETVRLDAKGEVECLVGINRDITQTRLAEEKLHISQKMDALGQLTGGISHDFNNMLGIILGYAELLETSVAGNDKDSRHVQEIISACHRARKLTSNLLTFSRRGSSEFKPDIINHQILNDQNMLERVLTAHIKLELDLADDLWPCLIDSELLGDAILNMSINAMHAMPQGGELSISTRNCVLNSSDTDLLSLDPGEYVLLRVSDTGIGMNEEARQKIFEPFFTTKGNIGTGLGMSQVYGLVKQAHGDIHIESFPGHGTQISIYMPRYADSTVANTGSNELTDEERAYIGCETIMVVDDEPTLLKLSREILEKNGYQVLVADNGKEAVQMLGSHQVDLLLSDVIMPEMNGYQLASYVREKHPDIKIQMISGYSDNFFISEEHKPLHEERLQKPYNSEQLLIKVRRHLDDESRGFAV